MAWRLSTALLTGLVMWFSWQAWNHFGSTYIVSVWKSGIWFCRLTLTTSSKDILRISGTEKNQNNAESDFFKTSAVSTCLEKKLCVKKFKSLHYNYSLPSIDNHLSFIYIKITSSQSEVHIVVVHKFILIWFAQVLRMCVHYDAEY